MSRRHGVDGIITPVVAADSLVWVESAASGDARISLYDVILGPSSATAGDGNAVYGVYHASGGTPAGVAATENVLASGDQATGAVALQDLTTDPTTKLNLQTIGLNQRASFRWVAQPGGEIMAVDTAGNGVGVQCIGFSAGAWDEVCSVNWME